MGKTTQCRKSRAQVRPVHVKLDILNEQGHCLDVSLCANIAGANVSILTSLRGIKSSNDHNIDLQIILSYPLGPVPFLYATADIPPAKTEKAFFASSWGLCQANDYTKNEPVAYKFDVNASLYVLSPIQDNFQDVVEMVLDWKHTDLRPKD